MKKRIAVLLVFLMLALPVAALAGNWDEMNWDTGLWDPEPAAFCCFINSLMD